MGKGDKKSKRGKIAIGSYGVRRRRKSGSVSHPAESEKTKVKEAAVPVEKVHKKAEITEITEEKPKVAKPKKKTVADESAPELPIQE
jgi:30S ribosomal protein S31